MSGRTVEESVIRQWIADAIANGVGGSSYLVYTAVLTQSGTDAPVATVYENTMGEINWYRTAAGEYYAEWEDGTFEVGKATAIPFGGQSNGQYIPIFGGFYEVTLTAGNNVVHLYSYSSIVTFDAFRAIRIVEWIEYFYRNKSLSIRITNDGNKK